MTAHALKDLLLKAAALFGLWLVLSGQYDAVHVVLGACFSLAIAWLHAAAPKAGRASFPWIRFILYLPWLFSRIVFSGLHITRLVLDPRMPLDPKLIRYRTQLRDPVAQVLLGNSITLTPGTVTAEISTSELVVHALDGHSASDLVSQRLERKVQKVFSRKGSS